ncbi:MAG: GNAT family N-acetyltransferase [Planctomycetes bacterium]|nr:GNAT family N-acetyltransferase [Planctomycetota bacterium]
MKTPVAGGAVPAVTSIASDDATTPTLASARSHAAAATPTPREVDRATVQRWLPQLDGWLLPGSAMYGVQHTWPQLYRSDGEGRFFAIVDGDELLSFCATRVVTVHGAGEPFAACLLGSVATAQKRRGQGLASAVLQHALAANAAAAAHTLLWAEQDGLYTRAGFVPGAAETCLVVARRPNPPTNGARLLVVGDHAAAHRLHQQKSMRVDRDLPTMSALLTTPGMTALGLERAGQLVAYACCGKGADLQGHWHEFGGAEDDVAALLQAGMHHLGQTDAIVLQPPWRTGLKKALGRSVVGEVAVAGPMQRSVGEALPACWIDGLDSV